MASGEWWVPTANHSLPTTHHPLPLTSYALPTASYLLRTTHYPLPAASYPLPPTRCLLLSTQESMHELDNSGRRRAELMRDREGRRWDQLRSALDGSSFSLPDLITLSYMCVVRSE